MEQPLDPNLITGFEGAEDAGVYKLTDDLAIVQTLDFFTPIVDDPWMFGQIAAANALSDVYAMGGKPLTAMNIVAFPIKKMDISILREIIKGGLEKVVEAGASLVGGHSIEDDELKYGLSITGIVHPDRVLTNQGMRAGDSLVLTKPLGTGIINTALKGGIASKSIVKKAEAVMAALNRDASEVMMEVGANACTDITGFGLLGHLCEMVDSSNISVVVDTSSVPILPETEEFAQMGLVPGGAYRNKKFREKMLRADVEIPDFLMDIMFDPQTSGGLLISVPEQKAGALMDGLYGRGIEDACIIGEVLAEPEGMIILV